MIHLTGTQSFCIGLVFVILIYDIYAVLKWGTPGTISRTLLDASKQYPIIAFALGLICGHLFWLNV